MTVRPRSRKEQIIDQATGLFAQHGYDKVTVKDLARACEITEPALYRHFKGKDAIYDAVLDRLAGHLDHDSLFASLDGRDELREILNGIADHILSFFAANKDPYRLLLYSTLGHHSKAKTVFRSLRLPYVTFLKDQLDRLYKAGAIVRKDNLITARCFVGMCFDCATCSMLWNNFQGRRCTPKQLIANNIPIFVGGLTASGHSTKR